jgi:hypothetical protein
MTVLVSVPLPFLVALGSILPLEVTAPSNPWPPSVVFRDGLLSVEPRERPWTEVLEEVCEKTGIRCRLYPPAEGSVSAPFSDLPLERALRRLFPIGAGVVFVYQTTSATAGSAAIPSEVWVRAKGSPPQLGTRKDPGNRQGRAGHARPPWTVRMPELQYPRQAN